MPKAKAAPKARVRAASHTSKLRDPSRAKFKGSPTTRKSPGKKVRLSSVLGKVKIKSAAKPVSRPSAKLAKGPAQAKRAVPKHAAPNTKFKVTKQAYEGLVNHFRAKQAQAASAKPSVPLSNQKHANAPARRAIRPQNLTHYAKATARFHKTEQAKAVHAASARGKARSMFGNASYRKEFAEGLKASRRESVKAHLVPPRGANRPKPSTISYKLNRLGAKLTANRDPRSIKKAKQFVKAVQAYKGTGKNPPTKGHVIKGVSARYKIKTTIHRTTPLPSRGILSRLMGGVHRLFGRK